MNYKQTIIILLTFLGIYRSQNLNNGNPTNGSEEGITWLLPEVAGNNQTLEQNPDRELAGGIHGEPILIPPPVMNNPPTSVQGPNPLQ